MCFHLTTHTFNNLSLLSTHSMNLIFFHQLLPCFSVPFFSVSLYAASRGTYVSLFCFTLLNTRPAIVRWSVHLHKINTFHHFFISLFFCLFIYVCAASHTQMTQTGSFVCFTSQHKSSVLFRCSEYTNKFNAIPSSILFSSLSLSIPLYFYVSLCHTASYRH